MATEIEHKYLVINDSYKSMAFAHIDIMQGYLNRDPERTVRVRTFGEYGKLTVKGLTMGDSRLEFEYDIPFDDARQLLALCEPGILHKTRWLVKVDDMTWEVDEYHDARQGLVIAEVELPSSCHRYSRPPFVGENVTGNPSYYNSAL